MKSKFRVAFDAARANSKPREVNKCAPKSRAPQYHQALGKSIDDIHPSVLEAEADALIAAGWGSHDRNAIPADWKEHRP